MESTQHGDAADLPGIQYENGEEKNLTRLFERMAVNREFARFFPEEPAALLESLLQGDRSQSREFAGCVFHHAFAWNER